MMHILNINEISMSKTIYFFFFLILGASNLLAQNYESYKTLGDTLITSENLGFDKHITVSVPFEWQVDTKQEFPLIIIFDRQNERSHQYILTTIDYLTSTGQIPSAIIISVASEQQFRHLETLHKVSNEKGLALENEKFIFDELIPLAEEKYKASPFRMLIGHSRYGYFTSSLFISRPDDLNAVISISPFYSQKNINLIDSMSQLASREFSSKKYYRFGIGNDYPTDFIKMDSTIKQLNNPSINAKGILFKEADHNATPGLVIANSLYQVFEEWAAVQSKYFSNEQKDLSIIDSLEKEILSHYGSKLNFSLGVLNGKGWFFYSEGQFESAIKAWELLMKKYPNFSEGHLYIIDAQMQLKQDTSLSIEKFNSSLLMSTIYSEDEKAELIQELENMTK